LIARDKSTLKVDYGIKVLLMPEQFFVDAGE
jgi:hypothetical protein